MLRNWARNQACRPAELAVPADEAALAGVLRRAADAGRRVRVVGAHHSWSGLACSDELLISLDGMQGVLKAEGRRVTVQAGMRLHQLNAALDGLGLAVPMLGSVDQQSVAGAISTATHGSGVRHGVMSTQVVALRLVLPSGEVRALSAEQSPELFDAARAGLGLFGVISAVTLDCVPAHRLEQRATPMPFEEALSRLPELHEAHEHVKIWWLPHQDTAQVYTADPSDAPATPQTFAEALDARVLNPALFPLVLGLGSAIPALIPPLNALIAKSYFTQTRRVDVHHRVLHIPEPPRHLEAEYSVPLDRAAEAFRGLRDLIEREGFAVNFMQELRPVAGDALPLSPCTGRDSAYISAYTAHRPSAPRFFEAVGALLRPMGARPHWGKLHHFTPAQLAAAYPQWQAVMALRREVDPEGRMLSPYVARLIGLTEKESPPELGPR